MMNRRRFLSGLIAAPVVVAAGSLMPVRLPFALAQKHIHVDPAVPLFEGMPDGSPTRPFRGLQDAFDAVCKLRRTSEVTIHMATGSYTANVELPRNGMEVTLAPMPRSAVAIENGAILCHNKTRPLFLAEHFSHMLLDRGVYQFTELGLHPFVPWVRTGACLELTAPWVRK